MRNPNRWARSARSISLAFALCLAIPFAALGEGVPGEIPGPSFEEVLRLRHARNPAISPDGSAVAFEVRTVDWAENRYDWEIWLAREGESPFQITRTAEGDSRSPRWAPNGAWLAFLADRGNGNQIYVLRASGGEAQAVTSEEEGVGGFRWSPDSRRIAYLRQDEKSSADKDRVERYGEFAVEDAEYHPSHIWVIDLDPDPWPAPSEAPCKEEKEGGEKTEEAAEPGGEAETSDEAEAAEGAVPCTKPPEPKRLTEGENFTVDNFEWSKDGSRLVLERRSDPLITSYVTADIAVLDVESGEVTPLVERPGYDGQPVWSPDSEWVLFYSANGNTTSDFYKNNRVAKVPASGGEPIELGVGFDEDISELRWTPRGIYFLAFQKTVRHLFRLDPETGEASVVGTFPDRIWSIDFSADGSRIALEGETDESLVEIYLGTVGSFEPAPLTDMTHQIADWELGQSEVISWQSRDGATIEGVLYTPVDFDPGRTYPLLVVIHGGPTGIDYPEPTHGYVYPINQWLAKGALVLQPNYRGSAGYGEAFRSLNVRNLGVGDAWDVLSGVDAVVARGVVDEERIAAMGWSQGGYISAFLTTHSDRFAAISVGAGISDWATYYVTTDIHPFTRQYLEGTPWADPEIYEKTSPMSAIRDAKTPTLIQHGEFDRRVPIPNAYELFQGLQDNGVESRLIVYKGFGHGITKPKERLAGVWHNWQWFAKYLWDEDVELPVEGEAQEENAKE